MTDSHPDPSPETFRALAESASAALGLVQDGRLRYANPALARLFGCSPVDLAGVDPLLLVAPEDRPALASALQAVVAGAEPGLRATARAFTRGGAPLELELTGVAAIVNGRPAVVATFVDNTERRRAERAAAERRDEVEVLHRASSSLMRTDDLASLCHGLVDVVESEVGHAHAELFLVDENGRRLRRFTFVADTESAPSVPLKGPTLLAECARTGEVVRVDDVTKDPRRPPGPGMEGSLLLLPLKVGERVLGVLHLESPLPHGFRPRQVRVLQALLDRAAVAVENARLHERLRDRTRQLERFHELALMMVGDPRETYRAIARQVAELLRTPHAAVVRIDGDLVRSLAEVSPEDERQAPTCPIELTPCRLVRDTREHHIVPEAAARFPRDPALAARGIRTYIGAPIFDRRGEVAGVVHAMDRRERRFGPDEIRILNLFARRAGEEMEEERREREKKATEQMLLQSDKLASLGQLVAGVAHEVNNPLASVLGLAESLDRREELSAAARASLAEIAAEADRARRVVRNLLAFARRHRPERVPASLNDVLEQTLALRENELRLSGVEVVRDLDPALPSTLADPHLLQQAFLNIVLNAEQAMLGAHGRGRLTMRTRFLPRGERRAGPTLRVEIEDDGPGIAEAVVPRVFEPFFTTKEVGKGTGLGLSLSHAIVGHHGGAIWVESRPGQGARFTIEVPYAPPLAAPEAAEPAAAAPTAVVLSGRRILLADDEAPLRRIARELLEGEGCVVEEAADSRAAVAHIEARPFDLVVSDVKMPNGGGLEVYRRACARDPALARRFLFVTGDVVSEETLRFLEESGCPHLEKPYGLDQLLRKVAEVLAAAQA